MGGLAGCGTSENARFSSRSGSAGRETGRIEEHAGTKHLENQNYESASNAEVL